MGSIATRVSRCLIASNAFFVFAAMAFAQKPASVPPLITQSIDESKRTVLAHNTHPLARPLNDRGAAPSDLPMKRMMLVLKRSPEQEHALLSLLDDQQDKNSPNYHKWLRPEDFGKTFGPANEDIQKVAAWLQSHGFEIGRVAKGKNIIEFSGVASQVQEAFHTSIHKYVVNGKSHWANANDPEIPTALTPVVAGIHTLHNFLKQPMAHVAEQKIQAHLVTGKDGKPHVTFPENPPVHALGPADFATIYNVSAAELTGFETNIAIVARSNIDKNNISDFANVFAVPTFAGLLQIELNGPDPGNLGGSEEAEATLDTTWSMSVAPEAGIALVVSASTNTTDGVDLSEAFIVDDLTLPSIMSESFGTCEASQTNSEAQGYSTLAEQAAAEGITYLVASGDSGAEGCDDPNFETVASGPLSVSVLSATPFNLAIGGTMFNEDGDDSKYWNSTSDPHTLGSAKSYIPENVWNESCVASACGEDAGIWATGGGASTFFAKPSWQSGVPGIPNDGHRDVPDVSLTAAGHDPYLLCVQRSCLPDGQGFISFFLVSGTSASTPSFAGIMALVDEKMATSQGNAGYVLYKLAATEKPSDCNGSNIATPPASTCIFNDVTVGNNAVPGESGYGSPAASYESGVGYDLATGLGSVNVANLVNKWNSVTFRPTTTTFSSSPGSTTHGQPVNFAATVAPQSGSGVPTGDVVVMVGNVPLGTFKLSGGTVSSTFSNAPGGSWVLSAIYSGDATFAPSRSNATSIDVSQEASSTSLSIFTLNNSFRFVPFNGGPYGSFAYLRADIAGQSGNGTPTGEVQFIDTVGTIPGNPYRLNSQGNTETPNYLNTPFGAQPLGLFTLPVGQNSITASYPGDNSFDASTSAPMTLTITQAPVTTVATGAPAAGKGATLTATLKTNSGGNAPTGTVTFYINDAKAGSTTTGSIVAPTMDPKTGALLGVQRVDTLPDALADGTYTVKATYSGDSNYVSSTSSEVKFAVQPDFVLSADADTIDVSVPGKMGSTLLHFTALDGYTGTINFSTSNCTNLPPGAYCAFSSSSLTGGGEVLLTITTTAESNGQLQSPKRNREAWLSFPVAFGLVAGVCLLNLPAGRKRQLTLTTIALCAVLIVGIACGGGASTGAVNNNPPPPPPPPPPTPAGTYSFVLTTTSGSLTHKLAFTLNVQ